MSNYSWSLCPWGWSLVDEIVKILISISLCFGSIVTDLLCILSVLRFIFPHLSWWLPLVLPHQLSPKPPPYKTQCFSLLPVREHIYLHPDPTLAAHFFSHCIPVLLVRNLWMHLVFLSSFTLRQLAALGSLVQTTGCNTCPQRLKPHRRVYQRDCVGF